MILSKLVHLLCEWDTKIGTDSEADSFFENKLEELCKVLRIPSQEIEAHISSITPCNEYQITSSEWRYICGNFHVLSLLNDELSESATILLSVQESRDARARIMDLLSIAVQKNLNPTLPQFRNIPTGRRDDILHNYYILKRSLLMFIHFSKLENLRMLILPHCLQGILVGVFQIGFCPLKKPSNESKGKFVMTAEIYEFLLADQASFRTVLGSLRGSIYPGVVTRETMSLFQANAPLWFKKALSATLTKIMKSKKGLEFISVAMLDSAEDDRTKAWKSLEQLTKLVMSCRNSEDFRSNVCEQVVGLLEPARISGELMFERIVVSCVKSLYLEDEGLCKDIFVAKLLSKLLQFSISADVCSFGKTHQDVTDDVQQSVRVLYGCFIDNSVNLPCLPIILLKPAILVLFNFCSLTSKSEFHASFSKEVTEIFLAFLEACTVSEVDTLFDGILFNFEIDGFRRFRGDINVTVTERILVAPSEHTVVYANVDAAAVMLNLLKTEQKLLLFGYLLKCITNKDRYFSTSDENLLNAEEFSASPVLERLLTTHKVLSQLADDKYVQGSLRTKPDFIINYVKDVLLEAISSRNYDSSEFIFTTVMILDNLISNSPKTCTGKYKVLLDPLCEISKLTSLSELKAACEKLVLDLLGEKVVETKLEEEASELDKALEDVTDPLLPVRGHALMVIGKLLEKKDKHAVERKQYLLNLFQLHLKNEDSFIYLNAVQGLAALADTFPDTVLEVLCEEYANCDGNTSHATRMKLGEVLVRVIRLLDAEVDKDVPAPLNDDLLTTSDLGKVFRDAYVLVNAGEMEPETQKTDMTDDMLTGHLLETENYSAHQSTNTIRTDQEAPDPFRNSDDEILDPDYKL